MKCVPAGTREELRSPALYLNFGTVLTVNVLKSCDSWRVFDDRLAGLSEKEKGDAFELLVKLTLQLPRANTAWPSPQLGNEGKLCFGGGTRVVGGRAHRATELRGQGRSQTEFGNEGNEGKHRRRGTAPTLHASRARC